MKEASLHIVEQLADQYTMRLQNGEELTVDEFVELHPEHREELRDFIEALLLVGYARPVREDVLPASIGRYQVIRELGRGGMGVVYLALDSHLDRQVAVKLLSRERLRDEAWLLRFQREARLASSLNHPNVVTIYEVGETEDRPYIAMEYVKGVTLLQHLNACERTTAEVLGIGLQVIAALSAAHQEEIVHRDLKPENVMVRSDGLVKVLDFGLAKHSPNATLLHGTDQGTISHAGAFMGTVLYMSPEQVRGQPLEVSSDLFGFGILLYLLLTGENPFASQTDMDVMAAILNRAPKPLSEYGHALPTELHHLIFECLSKEASQRPIAVDVMSRLRDICSKLPVGDVLPQDQRSDKEWTTELIIPSDATVALDKTICSIPSGVRYARSGDVNIAWQTLGEGPIDLVFVMGWVSHLDWFWRTPSFAHFLGRLAQFSRVILFDKRGTGLSDRVPDKELPTLEQRIDDVRAVMHAAGSEQAVLCGVSEGGPMCTLFAATYPQKTIALIMIGSYARRLWATDYPWGPTAEQRDAFLDEIIDTWGGPVGIETRAPSKANDPEFRQWWASYLRMGASPGAAAALTKMNAQIDVRPILSSIQVPTLVLHRSGDRCLLVEEGRYLAERIPGAKFSVLPGDDHLPFVGNADAIVDEIEQFLTGCRHSPLVDEVLTTIVFIALDRDASELEQFNEQCQRTAQLFRGRNMELSQTELLLTFDGPIRAVHAANAIVELAGRHNLNTRAGVHTGTCNVSNLHLKGAAVDRVRAIAHAAAFDAVLVSESTYNLVSGSELHFIDGGATPKEGRIFHLVR